jgi:hypothetical protein
LKETRHLLQIVRDENNVGPQPDSSIPVTLDISGMYSNLPWEEGMKAFEEALNRRDIQQIPTAYFLSLVMLVLSFNLFVFDSVLFLKLFVVVMGTKVAPTFAYIFMGWLELRMLAGWRDKGGLAPHWWLCYINYIIFLWSRASKRQDPGI